MSIGERIKKRRQELGLSAEDVANKLGISPATIYRYESNYINSMKVDKLTAIATVLHVSESYLMGWDDKNIISTETIPNSKEDRLILSFRQLNIEGQEKVLEYVDDLVSSNKYIKTYKAGVVD
jgi:DNA-binding helix-turn-helix protein